MRGIISSDELEIAKLKSELDQYPGLVGRDIVRDVTAAKAYKWDEGVIDVLMNKERKPPKKYKVVAFDYGVKQNILRLLVSHGCDVTVVPAATSAREVLRRKPDGVFLSNGPGDPAPVDYAIETIRELLGRVRYSESA